MTLRQLQEKREKLVADARSALEEIRKNTDDARTAELEKRHDDFMGDLDKLDSQIAREERMSKLEKAEEERRARMRPNPGGDKNLGDDDDKPVEYRQAFHSWVRAAGDMSALTEEERSALRAGVAPKEVRAQTVGTPAAGGYTVPTELANEIIKSMKAWGPMYDEDVCTVLTTSSGHPIDMPTIDDTAQTVDKHTEAGAVTDDGSKDAVFGKKTLSAHAYDTNWVRFSYELAQDSIFNMETLLGGLLGERLGRRANVELTVGDGTGDPQGIVVGSTLGKTAAATAAFTYDEVVDLVHSVDPAYRSSPKVGFQFHDTTLAALRKLKDGEGRYIWSAGDVQQGVPGTILGYRYRINQAMDTLAAAKKVMIFGDHAKYFVRKVGGIVLFTARERFAPDIGLLGLVRLDGRLGDAAAVKHLITAAS
ncbi:MAG TPA: phage major capsid protein [Bosea sp. (in: a-proteobacteria)]|jgi:HK97 family phage major capsid protein|nr:phage major capsid protein [Bosea sp. (in: a-proteobacteria)]